MISIIPLVTTIVQNSTTTGSNNPGQVIGVSDVIVAFIPYMLVFVAIGVMRIINMLGGMKEAWWRLRGIQYFAGWFFGPDGEPAREIFKYSDITEHSPAGFDYMGGRYFIDENARTAKYHGRMAWLWNWDEAEPIPYRNWKKGSPWNPSLIKKAFSTVIVRDMHRLGEPKEVAGKGVSALKVLVFATLIAVGIISLYFSYNAFCGNHPLSCGGLP